MNQKNNNKKTLLFHPFQDSGWLMCTDYYADIQAPFYSYIHWLCRVWSSQSLEKAPEMLPPTSRTLEAQRCMETSAACSSRTTSRRQCVFNCGQGHTRSDITESFGLKRWMELEVFIL